MEVNELSQDRHGRRHARFGTSCRARIRIRNRHYAGSLENISVSGAGIRTFSLIRDSGPTILFLPDLPPIEGTLRWLEHTVAGVLFDRQLDSIRLERWLESRIVCRSTEAIAIDRYRGGGLKVNANPISTPFG